MVGGSLKILSILNSHIRIWLHEIQRKRKKNFCQRKKIYIFIVQGFCATAYNIHIKKNIFLMTV